MRRFACPLQSLLWLFLGAMILLALPNPSWAAQGITVTPPFQDVRLTSSDTTKPASFALTNNTHAAVTISLQVVDFGALDQTGGVLFAGLKQTDFDTKHGLAQWVDLNQSTLTLEAGHSATITAQLRNDSAMSPGGHYGAVLATINSTPSDHQVGIQQSLASLLFVTKVGGEVYGLSLIKLQIDQLWWGQFDQVSLRFTNPGNVHVVPRGTVEVTDPLERRISQGIINDGSALLLPGTNRVFNVSLHELEFPWLPGFYTLTIHYRYDGIDSYQSQTERAFKLGLLLPIIAILGACGLLGWWQLRRYRRE